MKALFILFVLLGLMPVGRAFGLDDATTNGAALDKRADVIVEEIGKANAEGRRKDIPVLQAELGSILAVRRYPRAIEQLNNSKSEVERFYALNDAAKESLNKGLEEDAKRYASELAGLMGRYTNHLHYGNAVQDVNIVLGRIALNRGDIKSAKAHLLAAGRSPGSAEMDSFGPNMSLAKALLEKGEKDVVLEYFKHCKAFWKDDRLDKWERMVRDGGKPNFGAHLNY